MGGNRSACWLAVALLMAGCSLPSQGGFQASSCPAIVGENLGAPERQTSLSAGNLTVEVRYYGVRPGAGNAKCHNAVVGVVAKQAVGAKPPELTFTGKSGRAYKAFVSATGGANREVVMYLPVPSNEQLVKVKLKHGTKSDTASLQ